MKRSNCSPVLRLHFRVEAYRRFEAERCLPMLHKQPGLLGVLFVRQTEDHAASLRLWEDAGAVEALQSSPSYRQTTHELAESALLTGNESVEVFEVEGGDLRPEALPRALDRLRVPMSRRADLRTAYPCSGYEFDCVRSSPS